MCLALLAECVMLNVECTLALLVECVNVLWLRLLNV
jgi:hypothetical protein